MEQNDKLKVFISYSHLDKEEYLNEFLKHISPLEEKGVIEIWYDEDVIPGKELQENIDKNLDNADIVCFLVSANSLSSAPCIKEKKRALELRLLKGIVIIPIILSACGWKDDNDFPKLLALPNDGKPISKWEDSNNAWNDVYNGLKRVIEQENQIKKLTVAEEFVDFLEDSELLTKAHSKKENVLLDEIFIYPYLSKYDDMWEFVKKESSEKLVEGILEYNKILVAGENQSGKTSLCKKIFVELRKRNFIPIYVNDKYNQYQGKIENKLKKAFLEQYSSDLFEEIDKKKIIPIVDDFHYVKIKQKQKQIDGLSPYPHQIIIVDDVFSLNIADENLIKSYNHFEIEEFNPSLRNELIRKWTNLTDKKDNINHVDNDKYQIIDDTTNLVDSALGKIISNGIMPAYPFFILSIISAYESSSKPLDQEITSQGNCYQALIYLYLSKAEVKNDDIDTYINFLTELAFFLYDEKKSVLSTHDFDSFMKSYLERFIFLEKKDVLLNKLQQTQIISIDSFNNYSFCYSYLYYYFVAKYIADNLEKNKSIISNIIENLHKTENAYILIFLTHHSKNIYILEEIIRNASRLFENNKPASLNSEELRFFDAEFASIVKAALPPTSSTPEIERKNRLEIKDTIEQNNENEEENGDIEDDKDELLLELRRSIKTVEAMGSIIKNRAGSLEKEKLESTFQAAMNVHLRLLTSFLNLIKNKEEQQEIIDFISTRMEIKIEGMKKEPSQDTLMKMARSLFWNLNFSVVYGVLQKSIRSLGSVKLTDIFTKVCDNENTPAAFLIKHGILMWYGKNLQIDEIEKKFKTNEFSKISKEIMKFQIIDHASMHSINFKDKQRIKNTFDISEKTLLLKEAKGAGEKKN